MTRSFVTAARKRRVTQRLRVVGRPRDPAVTYVGFTCFRLAATGDADDPYVPIQVQFSTNTMFAFVGARS